MENFPTFDSESGCLKHTFDFSAIEIVDWEMENNLPCDVQIDSTRWNEPQAIGNHHLFFVYNRNLTHVDPTR